MTDRPLNAEVYRNAARHMEAAVSIADPCVWVGACDNIAYIATGNERLSDCAEARAFTKVFRPKKPSCPLYWGNDWGETFDERRACRILALCFMAAMVEAGDA